MIAAVNNADLVKILFGVGGATGFVGAILAILKWRPEATSYAVTQAQGVNDMMESLIKELRAQLDTIQKEHQLRDEELRMCRAQCTSLEQQVKAMSEMLRGEAFFNQPSDAHHD